MYAHFMFASFSFLFLFFYFRIVGYSNFVFVDCVIYQLGEVPYTVRTQQNDVVVERDLYAYKNRPTFVSSERVNHGCAKGV